MHHNPHDFYGIEFINEIQILVLKISSEFDTQRNNENGKKNSNESINESFSVLKKIMLSIFFFWKNTDVSESLAYTNESLASYICCLQFVEVGIGCFI